MQPHWYLTMQDLCYAVLEKDQLQSPGEPTWHLATRVMLSPKQWLARCSKLWIQTLASCMQKRKLGVFSDGIPFEESNCVGLTQNLILCYLEIGELPQIVFGFKHLLGEAICTVCFWEEPCFLYYLCRSAQVLLCHSLFKGDCISSFKQSINYILTRKQLI